MSGSYGFLETSTGLQVDTGPEYEPTPWADLPGDRDDQVRANIEKDRKPLPVLDTREKVGKWAGSTTTVDAGEAALQPRMLMDDSPDRRYFEVFNVGPSAVRIAPYPAPYPSPLGVRVPAGASRRVMARGEVYVAAEDNRGASLDVIEGS